MSALVNALHDMKPQRIVPNRRYLAEVVANNDKELDDDLLLGRIKFRILTLFDGIDDEVLPWALPHPTRFSGGADHGSFSVPDKGTEVFIEFQGEDVYNAIYYGIPYHKDNELSILRRDEDYGEYPKKHVIYMLSLDNYLTINTDYSDPELKRKLELRNIGNTSFWCGRNFDHYVKDEYYLNVDAKLEVKAVKESVTKTSHVKYFFNAKESAVLNYFKDKKEVVYGMTDIVHAGKSSYQFGMGAVFDFKGATTFFNVDKNPFYMTAKGNLVFLSNERLTIHGKHLIVEAKESLKLRGNTITKSVEIDFEDGRSTVNEMKKLIQSELKQYMSKNLPTIAREAAKYVPTNNRR